MSYHSSFKWEFEDEVTDELIDEIVAGLKLNKEYNQNNKYACGCYAIFSTIDMLIDNIGMFLDKEDKERTVEKAKLWAVHAPDAEKVFDIMVKVAEKLDVKIG